MEAYSVKRTTTLAKVVQLTTVHRAFDIRIFYKECRTLADAGHEVVLIAPHERTETIEGVRVVALRRARGRIRRALLSAWHAYRAARSENAAIYHFHDPELLPVGLALKARGARVVYDAHENLPLQILTKDWIPRAVRRPLAWLIDCFELFGARHLDAVVAATPAIAERFPADRTVLVRNFPLLRELVTAPDVPYADRPPRAIYVGGMHAIRGLHNMVAAIGAVDPSLCARLRLAGELSPTDQQTLEREQAWRSVDALGWQSREQITTELAFARVGLVVLHPRPSYIESLPIKLFEYMAAGVPVVASDFPLWRAIVNDNGCGLLVDPMDPRAIAAAIEWLLLHPQDAAAMGARGRRVVRERFNWETEGEALTRQYERLLA